MPPSNAAEVLTGFPPERQVEIVRRIATLGHTSPEAIKRVEAGLQKFLATQAFEERQEVGGVKTVSEILNVLDRSTERAILETIEEDDNELAEDIKKLMFVFDDLVLVDDRGMQNVLREIANEVLALALKTASDELKEKIFRNMSARAAETVQSEIEFMGPVRITDVEAAQSQVVEVVRRLEEAGDVVISGRGGETDLVE
jgi:flagellar motor switch protein FliG